MAQVLDVNLDSFLFSSIKSNLSAMHVGSIQKITCKLTLLTSSAIVPFEALNIFHLYNFNKLLTGVPFSGLAPSVWSLQNGQSNFSKNIY